MKTVRLFFAVLALLLLTACVKDTPAPSTPSAPNAPSSTAVSVSDTTTATTANTTVTAAPAVTTTQPTARPTTVKATTTTAYTYPTQPYENLACIDIDDTQTAAFVFNNRLSKIELDIPATWTLETAANGYTIRRGGRDIGYVTTVFSDSDIKRENSDTSVESDECTADYAVYKRGGDYRRRLVYTDNHTKKSLCIDVLYTEIDDSLLTDWHNYFTDDCFDDPARNPLPSLTLPRGRQKILIMGNSFVNTSDIGRLLQEMLTVGKTGYTVEAISVGMANVSTFSEDSYYMNKIRTEDYAAVFQCGLYSFNQMENMAKVYNVCRQTDTAFAAFPAHNEGVSLNAKYTYIPVLNWKGELNDLIRAGVERYDLCVDDYHQHSTPPAGYVGAHLIYRTMFGTLPPATSYTATAKLYLHDYPQSGNICFQSGDYTYIVE